MNTITIGEFIRGGEGDACDADLSGEPDLCDCPKHRRPTTVAVRVAHRGGKARSRCPNPRDCGDPSCAGDCGY